MLPVLRLIEDQVMHLVPLLEGECVAFPLMVW